MTFYNIKPPRGKMKVVTPHFFIGLFLVITFSVREKSLKEKLCLFSNVAIPLNVVFGGYTEKDQKIWPSRAG